jgi:hypothetical protein
MTKEDPSAWIAKTVADMNGYIKEIVDNVANLKTGSISVSGCLFNVDNACKRILCLLTMLEKAHESTRDEQKNLEDVRGPLRGGYGQAIEAARQRVVSAERHEAYAKLVAGPINRTVTDAIHKALEDGTLDLRSALEEAIRRGKIEHKREIVDKGLQGGSFPFFEARATEILARVKGLESVPEEDEPGVPNSSEAAAGGAAAGGAGKGRTTRISRKFRKIRSTRKTRKNRTKNRRRY